MGMHYLPLCLIHKYYDTTDYESKSFMQMLTSVSDYIVAISKLSINAGFGTGNALYNRLRNKLICGLHVSNNRIREALLKEGDALTWINAKSIAVLVPTRLTAVQINT